MGTGTKLAIDPFYPIVPNAAWVARAVRLGVRMLQLRYKSDDRDACRREIKAGLAAVMATDATLIINDHWQLALELGAGAVHLGQDDLAGADVTAIQSAGLALGVSTHDDQELARALAVSPDYVALGPVYETKLKKMPWAPQGLERVSAWKRKIGNLPLVAIGGLTPERAVEVCAAGADCASVITDIFATGEPEARLKAWLAWAGTQRGMRPQ